MDVFPEEQVTNEIGMLLFKIAREKHITLPQPSVHTYLAGILNRAERPDMNFVVQKPSDILEIARQQDKKGYSHSITYIVSRESGAYHLSSATKTLTSTHDAAQCLYYGSIFAREIGRPIESTLLGEIASNVHRYEPLLAAYFRTIHSKPDITLTDDDYENFKSFFRKTLEHNKKEKANAEKTLMIN